MAISLIILAVILVVVGLRVRAGWITDRTETRLRTTEIPKELTLSMTELGRAREQATSSTLVET